MNDNYVIHDGQLYHHGIKGMKWGIRRFQNPDGSLTPAGKKRYDDGEGDTWKARREAKRLKRAQDKINNAYRKKRVEDMTEEELKAATERAKLEREHRAVRPDDWKTAKEAKAEARAQRAQEKAEAKANKTGKQIHKKSIDDMSTEELAAAIERAKLEDTYRALRPPEISRGKQFVESMKNMAATVAVDEGKKLLGKLGDKLMDKYFPQVKDSLDDLKKKADIDKVKADAEKVLAEAYKTRKEADKTVDTTLDDLKKKAEIRKTNAETAKAAQEAKKTKLENEAKKPKPEDSDPNPPKNDPNPPKVDPDPPKKETYYPDEILSKPKGYLTSETSSRRSSYDTVFNNWTGWTDKTANESATSVSKDVSSYNSGKDYASNYTGLTVSELIRKQWDD